MSEEEASSRPHALLPVPGGAFASISRPRKMLGRNFLNTW